MIRLAALCLALVSLVGAVEAGSTQKRKGKQTGAPPRAAQPRWLSGPAADGFPDPYLGLTIDELRKALGQPIAVVGYENLSHRASPRKEFTVEQWPSLGYQLYRYRGDVYHRIVPGNELQYTFRFMIDSRQSRLHPVERLDSYEIVLDKPTPIAELASVVPEARPLFASKVGVYDDPRGGEMSRNSIQIEAAYPAERAYVPITGQRPTELRPLLLEFQLALDGDDPWGSSIFDATPSTLVESVIVQVMSKRVGLLKTERSATVERLGDLWARRGGA